MLEIAGQKREGQDVGGLGLCDNGTTQTFHCNVTANLLLSPIAETDLHAVIKKGNLLKDIHKCYILYQLLKATKFIHSGNVIHRDQKVHVWEGHCLSCVLVSFSEHLGVSPTL